MNHSGAYTCLSCTNPLTTVGEGSTYCDGCVAGYFWDTPTWDLYGYPALAASYDPYNPRPYIAAQCADCCVECDEDGTSCDARGATLETLPLERRWWRASAYSDDVYECALDDACAGGSNASAYCATGHEGALCGYRVELLEAEQYHLCYLVFDVVKEDTREGDEDEPPG